MPLRLKILVVENNTDCALSLAKLLYLWGHQRVEVVLDGPSAVASVENGGFDVVLLDLGLPALNGWDVATRIRAMPLATRPIIVAVTGHGRTEDRHRAADAGVDFYLLKPADPKQLQDLLQSVATRNQSDSLDGAYLAATE